MERNQPKEAIEPIRSAVQIINTPHAVPEKLQSHEKYTLKISKKEQKVEVAEKEGR